MPMRVSGTGTRITSGSKNEPNCASLKHKLKAGRGVGLDRREHGLAQDVRIGSGFSVKPQDAVELVSVESVDVEQPPHLVEDFSLVFHPRPPAPPFARELPEH